MSEATAAAMEAITMTCLLFDDPAKRILLHLVSHLKYQSEIDITDTKSI